MPAESQYSHGLGVWTSYVPTLTGSVSDPTLGTGAVQDGRYTRIGNLVIGWAIVQFGTSGTAAGSGNYRVSVPVLPRVVIEHVIGSAMLRDSSTGNKYNRVVNLDITSAAAYMRNDGDGGPNSVGAANPFSWAASDLIQISFAYEAA